MLYIPVQHCSLLLFSWCPTGILRSVLLAPHWSQLPRRFHLFMKFVVFCPSLGLRPTEVQIYFIRVWKPWFEFWDKRDNETQAAAYEIWNRCALGLKILGMKILKNMNENSVQVKTTIWSEIAGFELNSYYRNFSSNLKQWLLKIFHPV